MIYQARKNMSCLTICSKRALDGMKTKAFALEADLRLSDQNLQDIRGLYSKAEAK